MIAHAAKFHINAYGYENALIKMLTFAYRTENAYKTRLYLLTEKNAYKICLYLLIEKFTIIFAYQNVLIDECAYVCLKTSFYTEVFSTVESVASRPRGT